MCQHLILKKKSAKTLSKTNINFKKNRNNFLFDNYFFFIFYTFNVIIMKVKLFDEEHESDLEKSINKFLDENDIDIIDIKYQVAISVCGEDQLYCFSAMIIYS